MLEKFALSIKKISDTFIKISLVMYILGLLVSAIGVVIFSTGLNAKAWFEIIIHIRWFELVAIFIFPIISIAILKLNRILVAQGTSFNFCVSIFVNAIILLLTIRAITSPLSILIIYDNLTRSLR